MYTYLRLIAHWKHLTSADLGRLRNELAEIRAPEFLVRWLDKRIAKTRNDKVDGGFSFRY
jgi:hypothetical protein